jgi:hypothetical protein
MRTTIHTYRFDVNNPDEKAAYDALRAKLRSAGLKCFETWGGGSHYKPDLDGREIELETKHLFSNQWNTAPIDGISDKGLRVFDWAQDYQIEAKWLKRGHWLEQTAEMREIRRNTNKCGYCGSQEPAAKGYVFCPHCLDSVYLVANMLHLTRMLPVDAETDRAPLTEAESAHLLPQYRAAQTQNTEKRNTAARREIESECANMKRRAHTKRDGMLWLLDHGFPTDNVIYYSTDLFCFGWRSPIDAEVLSALLDIISEFPFPYEIKCADGSTLSAT